MSLTFVALVCAVGLFGLVFTFVFFWFLSVYVLCVAVLRILVVALLRWVFGGWFGVFSSIAGVVCCLVGLLSLVFGWWGLL